MANNDDELAIIENTIRDFLAFIFHRKYGDNWLDHISISEGRKESWQQRKETEVKRLSTQSLEQRILYYSDFYDLKTLILKNWDGEVQKAFKDKKMVEVFLTELEKLRDPNAHRRSLYSYQGDLIRGISGELRTRIMKYRGKKENPDDYFPVIEAVSDSLGNQIATPSYAQMLVSDEVVRVGDEIEIQVFSTDPMGEKLEFSIERIGDERWTENSTRKILFSEEDIGKTCDINICVKSKRDYHAYGSFDDYISIRYVVLPK